MAPSGGWVVLALFVTPILFMLTGSLRKAGLPPPRGLEFLPAPLAFDNFSLRNSLVFVLAAVPLRLLGAFGLALLFHTWFRGVGTYRTGAYLPTVVPDVAFALLWFWILNPLYGPLNAFLGLFGDFTPAWLTNPDAAQAAVVIMSLFQIGEGFIVALATRQEIPDELYRNAFEYLRYGYAAAATLVMFVVTAVIVLIQYRIVRRWRKAFIV